MQIAKFNLIYLFIHNINDKRDKYIKIYFQTSRVT